MYVFSFGHCIVCTSSHGNLTFLCNALWNLFVLFIISICIIRMSTIYGFWLHPQSFSNFSHNFSGNRLVALVNTYRMMVSNILMCCVCVLLVVIIVYPMLPVLWIVHCRLTLSVFANVYLRRCDTIAVITAPTADDISLWYPNCPFRFSLMFIYDYAIRSRSLLHLQQTTYHYDILIAPFGFR